MDVILFKKNLRILLKSIKKNSTYFKISQRSDLIEDYNLDSLEFMQLITALEKKYNIEFDYDATYEELNSTEYLFNEINKKCSH